MKTFYTAIYTKLLTATRNQEVVYNLVSVEFIPLRKFTSWIITSMKTSTTHELAGVSDPNSFACWVAVDIPNHSLQE